MATYLPNDQIDMRWFHIQQHHIDAGLFVGTRYGQLLFEVDDSIDKYIALYQGFVRQYGTHLFEHYANEKLKILSKIASGAFGTLYLVQLFGRMYAIKMEQCNGRMYTPDEFRTKVRNEHVYQRKVYRLGYALRVYEYGVYEFHNELFSFITMELLDHAIEPFLNIWRNPTPATLTPDFFQLVMSKVNTMLRVLEDHGIVHGDLHWNNLMIETTPGKADFDLVLIDFGMSTDWIPELQHLDYYALYIHTVSIDDIPLLRQAMRQLLMQETPNTEQELVRVPRVYAKYDAKKKLLFRQLGI
jgi:tRNA A-37 threonylcarbamoyl transferase component Bud32